MRVVAPGPGALVEPGHGFQVVVQDIRRRGGEDFQRALEAAPEVRHEDFYRGARRLRAHRTDAIHEMLRAAVAQIVTIHAGDDDVGQVQSAYGVRKMPRL